MTSLGRLARTIRALHPLQIAARVPHAAIARVLRDVPSRAAPELQRSWPAPPGELVALAERERERAPRRIARLSRGTRLRAYEETYGAELGVLGTPAFEQWHLRTAVEPFPASVRARHIAVAVRCGRRGLDVELARAARAVALQLEVHLLGNHLLENAIALACAGAAARGLEADAWWKLGSAILRWQLSAQFLADGGHFERTASYHLALTTALVECVELARASGRGAPRQWTDVAERALGWARAVRAPDGTYPLFNDASLDAAPAIDEVVALGVACDLSPCAAVSLVPTGWILVRDGHSMLAIDAGPDGAPHQPGHAHADGLTFELWTAGARAIADFGVASYAWDAARAETRSTHSHNTVELDGLDSCEVWGAFRVGRRGRGSVRALEVRGEATYVEVEHDGYAWRPGAPRVVRAFEFGRGRLVIVDRIEGGASNGRASEFASRLRLTEHGRGALRISGNRTVTACEDSLYPSIGDRRPALVLEQRALARAPIRWCVEW